MKLDSLRRHGVIPAATFLYTDEEEVTEVACGDQHLTTERVTQFRTPSGRHTLYAIPPPWSPVGVLHVQARHADGTTEPEQVKLRGGPDTAHVSNEHDCA
ncbi:hypothetical protein PUR71_37415 [Streptomyces sp. SP17BM10]|uniref:hypothetical protein n=1 Tax=Streptomyces sp. SP17BM10 TaxID=3002530 RepID=UPI002E79EF60|nr:hypothetical protein [Streptomyces sp. SP17BM10]MEE1788541.1 hypothetical protein [Streptomyces sp. SP17BM10]